MIGVNFDISERRRAEDQRQLLMSEMQHRLRNLLTVVNAVAQVSDRSENVELYREALLARLNAIQGAQRLLLDAPSGAPTLSDLLVPELAPYSNKDASNIVLEGPLVAIPTVLGIPLGLAVHELATNAAKYGALSVPSGKLEVSWAVSAQENGQKLSLRWREHGGPPVQPPRRRGFGTTLLQRSLGRMEGASVGLDSAPEGLRCLIELPLLSPLDASGTRDMMRSYDKEPG